MQHFFVDASQVSEETIRIEGSDVNHMKMCSVCGLVRK